MSQKSPQEWDLQITNISWTRDQRSEVCFFKTGETATPMGQQMQQQQQQF